MDIDQLPRALSTKLPLGALIQFSRDANLAQRVVVCAQRFPGERALVARKARKLGSPFVGKHCNIDRGMKAGGRGDRALTNEVHQAKAA